MSNDALADLGLDVTSAPATLDIGTAADAAPVTENTEVAKAPVATPAVEADDETSYEVGEIEVGVVASIPALTRLGGGAGSKYPFAKLTPPTDAGFSTFTVKFAGGDEGKFKRSVQSATTQANRAAKDRGENTYYTSRTVTVDGKFVGVAVYRTDARPEKEEEGEAAAE